MAWIKVEDTTPDKPEVIGIADILGIDQDAAFGKLVRIWIWADQQTYNGNAGGNGVSVTRAFLDRCACVTGFANAMVKVGWLLLNDDGSLIFPNFDRHNGETAKQRALASKRVAIHRAKSNGKRNGAGVTSGVTKALPDQDQDIDQLIFDQKQVDPIRFDPEIAKPIAARLFKAAGYTGDKGLVFWQAGQLVAMGLLSEADAFDVARGCVECRAIEHGAYFRKSLINKLKGKADANKLLGRVKVPKNFHKGPPPAGHSIARELGNPLKGLPE